MTRGKGRFLIGAFWLMGSLCCLTPLALAKGAPLELLAETSEHVAQTRYGEAIRVAEAAADRGVVDADLSFNRGLSYLRRAETSAAEAGDLAQAAAGFAEALELRPGDPEAERGLEQARLLIAQDRAQPGTTPDSSNLGIFERVLQALPPFVLAVVAGLGSLTLSIGLWLFSSPIASRKVPGGIMSLLGVLLLVPALFLAGLQHMMFHNAKVAVVVADRAEITDASGKRIVGRLSYRKGTLLHLGPAEGSRVPLLNFGEEGFIPIARVRFLSNSR